MCRLLFGVSRGGFEFGDTGGKDSAEISLRRSVEVAGPVESVECEAKLCKSVAWSCGIGLRKIIADPVSLGTPAILRTPDY